MYIHIQKKSKWSHQVTVETVFQLDIFCRQVKPPVPKSGLHQIELLTKAPVETPK